MRIEVSEGKIEGLCRIPGWNYDSVVICLMRNLGRWTVGSSMTLVSDIDVAREMSECVSAVFAKLYEIKASPKFDATKTED